MLNTVIAALCVLGVLTTASQAAPLPVSRVVLFSSGVGYFEREGMVEGNTEVELSFRVEQINDILKSLVLQDLNGGTIAPVTYAPQDPLEKTLSAFAVDISGNPSVTELWDQLRGARVQVVADRTVEGTVFGAEEQLKSVGDQIMRFDVLNLVTSEGLVGVPLWHISSIRLLDEKLDADLRKALAAIDSARDVSKRPVTLSFMGEGERTVRVGYLLETPVWKTSYRLVNDDDGLFLQGWAIVENTTDDDWTNVALTMVSGRPVSFIQDLYSPLYLNRPVVPPSVQAAARPRTWAGAIDRAVAEEAEMMAAPAPMMEPARARVAAPGPRGERGPVGAAGPAGPGMGMPGMMAPGMMAPGMSLADAGVAAMADGERVGTLFRYGIRQPVTVARQRSAMIPIVNATIDGEKLSVYSRQVDEKRPMNGVLLKNTSGLHLMGGALTVFDGGIYGGDALMEDVAPGEERLLTYAMDLTIEVDPQSRSRPDEFMSASVVRGLMRITRKSRTEMNYNIKSSAETDRVVLVEHPLRPDWNLVEPEKADERTRDAYRFRVPVEAGALATLKVVEERPVQEVIRLVDRDLDQVRMLLQVRELSDAMKAALQQIASMQEEMATLAAQRAEKEARIREIEQEQERIRQNMAELDRQSQLYRQYVEKFTEQEQEFETLRTEIRQLRAQEDEKRKALQDFILGLEIP